MSNIRVLPENLANQIAAGEVVERPASVVKEFVENAIDAGATNITVVIAGGGTRLIRVIDDGLGMDSDDVLLCLERHATSKVKTVDDLAKINTLGFRGEAVPSIASVAKLTITSKTARQDLGTRAEIRFGKLVKIHEMGCATGTTMEIKDLFGNVPARRKFLKTARTELSHIEEVCRAAALANNLVGFTYQVDDRLIWDLPQGESGSKRVQRLLKFSDNAKLLGLNAEQNHGNGKIVLSGHLLAPDETSKGGSLRIFVCKRPVRDRMLNHAVSEGLQGFLMKGRRPVGVLFLDLPPDAMDVNVHPTKQEIRFLNSGKVHTFIVKAVAKAMLSHQDQVKYSVFGKGGSAEVNESTVIAEPELPEKKEQSEALTPSPKKLFTDNSNKTKTSTFVEKTKFAGSLAQPDEDIRSGSVANQCPTIPDKVVSEIPSTLSREPEQPYSTPENNPQPKVVDLPSRLAGIKYIGQFQSSFLLCESSEGLIIIDQHAVHERLLFEKLKKQYNGGKIASQALLFPEMVECSIKERAALEKNKEEIRAMGLDISEFGGDNFVIKAIPALLSPLGPLQIYRGIIEGYLAGSKKTARRLDDSLASMACKAAVKANHQLQPAEAEALIADMLAADVFSHCPHGRPVYQQFSVGDVRKWFKRT